MLALLSIALAAQEPAAPRSDFADGVLVTVDDVPTCPYTVIGPVTVNVRPTFIWNKSPTAQQVFAKLRAKAQRMGADAVVLATYGGAHFTMTNIRTVTAAGRAVRFNDPSCAPKPDAKTPTGTAPS